MPDAITLEGCKAADRAMTVEEARRGFTIHFGVRQIHSRIEARQARIERRVAQDRRAHS
jgi:hypothetical protein